MLFLGEVLVIVVFLKSLYREVFDLHVILLFLYRKIFDFDVTLFDLLYRKVVDFKRKLTLFAHSERNSRVAGSRRRRAFCHERAKKSLTTCYSILTKPTSGREFARRSGEENQSVHGSI